MLLVPRMRCCPPSGECRTIHVVTTRLYCLGWSLVWVFNESPLCIRHRSTAITQGFSSSGWNLLCFENSWKAVSWGLWGPWSSCPGCWGFSITMPPFVPACHSWSFTPAAAQELPRGELTLTSLRGCDTKLTSTPDVGADDFTEGNAQEADGAGKVRVRVPRQSTCNQPTRVHSHSKAYSRNSTCMDEPTACYMEGSQVRKTVYVNAYLRN